MKKHKLTLTPELSVALISVIDGVINHKLAVTINAKLIQAALIEIKERLVTKSFLQQGEFKVSLSHVQALALKAMIPFIDASPTTHIGNYLLQNSNSIAQKYNV